MKTRKFIIKDAGVQKRISGATPQCTCYDNCAASCTWLCGGIDWACAFTGAATGGMAAGTMY
jgi:hypothetical protein